MGNGDGIIGAITRAARATLRRTGAAFNLVYARFDLDVFTVADGGLAVIMLGFDPRDGREPLWQSREVPVGGVRTERCVAASRLAVDEMARNAALAFRPERAGPPTGWSVHPAAASVIAAAGTALPNPADPVSWLQRDGAKIHLPDGGHVARAVFSGVEGVLMLQHARIVSSGGATVMTLGMDGPHMLVQLHDAYPDALADALVGRTADRLCDVFAADQRSTKAVIAAVVTVPDRRSSTIVTLADRLVPLLGSVAGGERWRPKKAVGIVGPPDNEIHRLLGHRRPSLARYSTRSALHARLACRLTRQVPPPIADPQHVGR